VISKKPVKIIIEYSKEAVSFADFINEVLDFEEECKIESKRPPAKEVHKKCRKSTLPYVYS
jgi:hypothetical protein